MSMTVEFTGNDMLNFVTTVTGVSFNQPESVSEEKDDVETPPVATFKMPNPEDIEAAQADMAAKVASGYTPDDTLYWTGEESPDDGAFATMGTFYATENSVMATGCIPTPVPAEETLSLTPLIELKLLNKELYEKHTLPHRATSGAAGMDLRAGMDSVMLLAPGETLVIPTGLAVHIGNPHIAGMIIPRSGLGTYHGIVLANGTGLIDSDYQGELKVALWNRGNDMYRIEPGDRIAQLFFIPVILPMFTLVDEFTPSERGEGGFGSTGK